MGGWDAPWHWVVIAILVIALFGYKKLPDAARAMGRSLRIFKTEIKGMSEDDRARDAARDAAQTPMRPAVEPGPASATSATSPSPSGDDVAPPVTTPTANGSKATDAATDTQ